VGSSDSSMDMMGSDPVMPALAMTISILRSGECDNANLKTESCSDHSWTSHLMNLTLLLLVAKSRL